jgi:DNA mismatch repair ATPase MutS
VVFLTDVYWLLKAERLKRNLDSATLISWSHAVGELEALNSLAGFSYSNPAYSFPRLSQEPYVFQARTLGHPLIAAEARVTNAFSLPGQGSIGLVTGSNMAGKSTFLRTVGVNTVLALAGAPVCAGSLTVSVLQVFTSMRTRDDLSGSTSSFQAELRRIGQLLNLLRTGDQPVLFLLDEMLKGTNSADRQAGSAAVVRQLIQAKTFGLLSTHDLELVSLAEKINLINYSFNSQLQDGKIIFDYRLTSGPCHTANATALMRQMGIGI